MHATSSVSQSVIHSPYTDISLSCERKEENLPLHFFSFSRRVMHERFFRRIAARQAIEFSPNSYGLERLPVQNFPGEMR